MSKNKLDLDDLDTLLGSVNAAAPDASQTLTAADLSTAAASTGEPLMLSVDAIRPDPTQPRTIFDPEKMRELTESIKVSGVKSPISVKRGMVPGTWLINFGERRWCAAKLAGLSEIPAFIDETHDDYGQMVENVQRDDLRPIEIGRWIGAKLAAGVSQKEIGLKLSKSKQWVSAHAQLAVLPSELETAALAGKVTSADGIGKLKRLLEEQPAVLEAMVELLNAEIVTDRDVREFCSNYTTPQQAKKAAAQTGAVPDPTAAQQRTTEPAARTSGVTVSTIKPVHSEGATTSENAVEPATRTSTSAEQQAALEQHEQDAFFRSAHADEEKGPSIKGSQAKSRPAGELLNEGRAAIDSKDSDPQPTVHVLAKPLLMVRVGSRGGTLKYDQGSDDGLTGWIRWDDSDQLEAVGLNRIELVSLISE